jgi:hypothetical protein
MILVFAHGHTGDLAQPDSIAWTIAEQGEDWQYYYVGM